MKLGKYLQAGLLFIACLYALNIPAFAYTPYNDYDNKVYNELIVEIIKDPTKSTYKYAKLRRHYSNIDEYDPNPVEIIAEMNALAPIINPSSDNKQDILNFDRFKKLMLTHFANIAVIRNAAILSQTYPYLINQGQAVTVYKQLVKSILLKADGKTMHTAYILYAVDEEKELLQQLGLKLLAKEIKHKGKQHYAVYTVYDPVKDLNTYVYANITDLTNALVAKMDHQEEESNKSVIIGK